MASTRLEIASSSAATKVVLCKSGGRHVPYPVGVERTEKQRDLWVSGTTHQPVVAMSGRAVSIYMREHDR